MVVIMTYTPSFAAGEFWKPSPHYNITIGGRRILYAYIRKNACTAFKRLINRRLHPTYAIKKALGQEKNDRYHIQGNMKYFALPREKATSTFLATTRQFLSIEIPWNGLYPCSRISSLMTTTMLISARISKA